ncbi:restriction endonuclease subunit S [uncultured Akkermansia sp.]|uniref:restriction endonuclease subunit S n=1 Tax=uncultured Akkermansia sp. TaxID=512294 RepID=UPI00259A38DB|nr:restriction endonuclease subunit S [uncultured Akkermansia sp.]
MNRQYLRNIADIQTGPFGSQLHKEDYVNNGTPIVTVEHLGNRVFTKQNLPKVSDKDKVRLTKYVLQKGDIVFSRVGSVDRCSYVDEVHDGWMFSGRCLRVRPIGDIDPLFLYYFFCLEKTKQFVRNIAVGATMPSINTKLLGEVEIVYPVLDVQRKIVKTLSAIDEKIENNQKINDNLLTQAQAIYTEIFSTNAKSEWKQGHLSDLISVKYGKDHKKLVDGHYPVYGSGGIMRCVERPLCEKESVLIPRKGSLNNVIYVNEPFWSVDTMFYTEMKKPNVAKFVYHFVKSKDLASMNAGSAVPSMTTDILNAMEVVIPSSTALSQFENIVSPMYLAMQENKKQNEKLSELRDNLLPMLMSGEIDVSSVKI